MHAGHGSSEEHGAHGVIEVNAGSSQRNLFGNGGGERVGHCWLNYWPGQTFCSGCLVPSETHRAGEYICSG